VFKPPGRKKEVLTQTAIRNLFVVKIQLDFPTL